MLPLNSFVNAINGIHERVCDMFQTKDAHILDAHLLIWFNIKQWKCESSFVMVS